MSSFFNLKNNLSKIIPIFAELSVVQENIVVVPERYVLICLDCLKNHITLQYKLLSCISGVDLVISNYRFSVVYDLLSLAYNTRIRVKLFIDPVTSVLSSCSIYKCADWWEREIWDMFGIWFENHPDLRRILTDYGFDGFPLRKDFPLIGYSEILYDFNKKRIISKPCELSQDFRFFLFENSWLYV